MDEGIILHRTLRQFYSERRKESEDVRIREDEIDEAAKHICEIADAHLDRVSMYGAEGDLLLSIGGAGNRPAEFSFPAGIAAHPDGRVAVVDSLNNRLKIFRVLETGSSDGA